MPRSPRRYGSEANPTIVPVMTYGGIEAGGTKWVCAVADDDGSIVATERLPTTTPAETIGRSIEFFQGQGRLDAIGIGSFGPVDLHPASPTYGSIKTTPKPGWNRTDVIGPFRDALGVPVAFDTDVNAAALGEARRGAGIGLHTLSYVTVGTGIGGGALVDGEPLHGALHPELGHLLVPHDRERDPFAGSCPYHGDCFEGLAAGTAIRERCGRPAEELSADHPVWELEAEYLAFGLLTVVYNLSPQRIVLGGGVPKAPGLLARVRDRMFERVAGYLDMPAFADRAAMDDYLVAPGLGDRAGVVGAIELARRASA